MITIAEQKVEFANEMARRYGPGHIVSTQEVKAALNAKHGTKMGSSIPSDYCYNRINNGVQLSNSPFFEFVKRGQSRCYGVGYPFNGLLYHKPKGRSEYVVGKCINGIREVAPENERIDSEL